MRISEETIRRIKDAAIIEEVVGDFVSLKRKGANLWACCPFHHEKTPSFSVSPAKGIYKCFGCGAAGDSVKFIMDIEGLSYPDALRYLANKYNIEIEESYTPNELHEQARSQRESMLVLLNFAKNFFKTQLLASSEGQSIGLSYFKERNIHLSSIETFELGYSLNDWHALEQAALKQQFNPELLEKTGLVVVKQSQDKTQRYDRFRGRVIFPIHDLSGKVIAFGARALKTEDQPKYLNSPEIEGIYLKGETLYGIFQAKKAIRQADHCFLTEGYLDVIAMHQAGIANVVASSGTSLTEEQIRLIKRFTDNVTVLYDGDTAGIKASLRGIDMLLEQGMNVHAVALPEGEDPDSFIRKQGAIAFKNYLQAHTTDFVSFKACILLTEQVRDPLKKAEIVREIIQSVAKIPDAIKRELFIQQCTTALQVREEIIRAEISQMLWKAAQQRKQEQENILTNKAQHQPDKSLPPLPEEPFGEKYDGIPDELVDTTRVFQKSVTHIINRHEQECIRLLLKYGQHYLEDNLKLWQYLLHEIDDIEFHTPLYRRILEMYKDAILQGEEPDVQYFIRYASPEVVAIVANITESKYEASPNWELMHNIYIPKETDKLPIAVYENILRLKKEFIEKLESETFAEIKRAEKHQNDQQVVSLLQAYSQLAKQRVAIAKELGNVVSVRSLL
ncbi:MAG: DNA primase [Cytophagales bacterium]|nr:DNA primase [Bernardetiaceae bacterium]MDW8206143.1 DNA primase [Cytophagales bacterium]